MRNQNEQKTNYKNQSEWKMLLSIKQIIFDLDEENIIDSANLIIKHIVNSNLISFNMVIIQIIYQAFVKNLNNFDLYIKFMKEIETFEENNKPKIFDVFICYLINKHTQESYCLINYLIEHNFYDSKIVQNLKTPYFMHYMSQERILFLKNNGFLDQIKDIEELSKNDWELHKQFVKEGVNPNEIAKIIRKDDIEKLQEISSQENFNFNQEIEPSLYERCDYINLAYKNVSLINYAAFFSAVKCFKYLLINNVNVNNTGKYAVAGGNLEIIHLCQQNHSSFEGAYEAAIKFHRNDIFKYIYENKFDICGNLNRLGKKCISYHNYEIFIFLIEEGMKINDSTITEAAKIGNIFLVKSFLKENQFPKSILIFASESGNIELIKYILDQKIININGKYGWGYTALMKASINNRVEIVKLLLEQEEIDINAKDDYGDTALINASENGHTKIVKLLLEQEGIDINAKDDRGETALMWASNYGHTEIVKLLLEQKGIDINAKDNYGRTALMKASEKGYIEIVKLLLEQKRIDINDKDNEGKTALMQASYDGHQDVVELLLEQKGIIINTKDKNGATSLMYTSTFNYLEITKILLEIKVIDINNKDNKGYTALMLSSKKGNTEIVKLILEQEGIDINSKNSNERTALMIATRNNHKEIVKLLLEQEGIDINIKDHDENTALSIACQKGFIEIVKLFNEFKSNKMIK